MCVELSSIYNIYIYIFLVHTILIIYATINVFSLSQKSVCDNEISPSPIKFFIMLLETSIIEAFSSVVYYTLPLDT